MDEIFHIGFESEGLNSDLAAAMRTFHVLSCTTVWVRHSFPFTSTIYRGKRRSMLEKMEKIDCAVGSETYLFTTHARRTLASLQCVTMRQEAEKTMR